MSERSPESSRDCSPPNPPSGRCRPSLGSSSTAGGILTLANERTDIRLAAIRNVADAAIAIGLDTKDGIDWLGSVSPDAAAAAAMATARAFLDVISRAPRQRMRDLSAEGLASLRSTMRPRLDPLTVDPQKSSASSTRRDRPPRFERRPACCGNSLTLRPRRDGSNLEIRHRDLAFRRRRNQAFALACVVCRGAEPAQSRQAILDAAVEAGFITDPADPLLQIEACPGAPACASTSLDTRGDARRLAAMLARSHFTGTVHVSGCAKGCAKSGASDLVLVGAEGRYGIVRNGTAQDCPSRSASFAELAADPCTILDPAEGRKA